MATPSPTKLDPDTQHFIRCFSAALMDTNVKHMLGLLIHDHVELATTDYEERLRSLEAKNLELDIENKRLSIGMHYLEKKMHDLEQYGRRNALRFHNPWPEQQGENTDQLITDFVRDKLGVTLAGSDIGRSHRVGDKRKFGNKPRPIIVKFNTYRIREKVARSRSKLRDADENARKVMIVEDLTASRAYLAYKCRELKRKTLGQAMEEY